ncbi:MAG: hypothetical protein HYX71_12810 [Opitutae bacterium]|nr:hypothetical protein [Opitutae bacterium]
MNHLSAPRQTGRLRTLAKTFSLLLLQPILTPGLADAHARSRLPARQDASGASIRETEPTPYLTVIGAVPLRFGAPPPPPDLTTKPTADAPPDPAPVQTVAATNRESVIPALPAPATVAQAPVAEPPPAPAKPADPTSGILPDDTRPAPRPEDFLPFFQFPGSTNNPVRSPGPVPPSSATYQQK